MKQERKVPPSRMEPCEAKFRLTFADERTVLSSLQVQPVHQEQKEMLVFTTVFTLIDQMIKRSDDSKEKT